MDAIPAAAADMTRTLPIYFPDKDLMLKIEDYVPPMKEELYDSVLAIDTWNRETLLPPFFYKYFTETFMIPAYTCDTIIQEPKYPGLSTTYSCFCNDGDYHEMPEINFEITGKDFQYDS